MFHNIITGRFFDECWKWLRGESSPEEEKLINTDQGLPIGELINRTRAILAKPLRESSVHIDLPRLSKRLSVGVIETEDNDPVEQQLKTFFDQLAAAIDDGSNVTRISDLFASHVGDKSKEISARLASFLSAAVDTEAMDPFVVYILKTCTQSAVAPILVHLKLHLGNTLRFNSVPYSWSIGVQRTDIGAVVTHSKKEIAKVNLPEGELECTFDWKADFFLSRSKCDIVDLGVELIDVDFAGASLSAARSDEANRIRSILVAAFTPQPTPA